MTTTPSLDTVLTARGPEDLIAAVPVMLGFHPEASLVMLTFGSEHAFHARVGLPPPGDEAGSAELVEPLLAPCLMHGVARVALVAYTDDAPTAARLAAVLVPAFMADGIGVVAVLRVHAGRWWRVPLRAGGVESAPTTFDPGLHPFAARGVLAGRVTLPSREQLRGTVARRPDVADRWQALMDDLPRPGPVEVAQARALVAAWVEGRADPDDAGAARVLQVVSRVEVRDALLYGVTRETAPDHLTVWSSLLRGAPDAQVPDTAAVTAFCAWLSGDGALAWCALDRCLEADPDHVLGRCLGEALTKALPPSCWDDAAREASATPADDPMLPTGRPQCLD